MFSVEHVVSASNQIRKDEIFRKSEKIKGHIYIVESGHHLRNNPKPHPLILLKLQQHPQGLKS